MALRHRSTQGLAALFLPAEGYRVHNNSKDPIKFFVSNGPGSEDLVLMDRMPATF